ncbi:alkaline phosphatase family protein [Rhodohalobacter sp. SW132]|uniref:alkaline phosphatase family protein n=1 Tax=Rhodohalobacter sp. SW132 TaxID=2293433 RepID=UPI0013140C3E|nr:alkaline phosphatase family protein [Rhodohalobacter sp. SW132]
MKSLISFYTIWIIMLIGASGIKAQQHTPDKPHYDTPNLVVGLIVDQMRPDYIYKYWDHYEEGGIKRLLNEGHTFRNAYFRHLQTSTGPGHAAQLSGATPSVHGLIGNSWYVRELDRNINVIEAVGSGYEGVGSRPEYNGEKSPINMLTTTVGDELFMFTGERSKTVGISRKDRGAILPAGHTGDAYWYEGATGNFITSTYYMDELPGWLQDFNDRNLPQEYLTRTWETLLPVEGYVESRPDDNPYEGTFSGMDTPTFPVDLAYLVEEHDQGPGLLNATPFADELLFELAVATMEGEELGRGDVTDMLMIALSAADAIGHRFGPGSKQVQDYYLRLDRYMADFFDYLDSEFGMDNVLVFLTADHGGAYIPEYMSDLGIPTGHSEFGVSAGGQVQQAVREYLEQTYGEDFLLAYSNQNLFLDHDYIDQNGMDHVAIQKEVQRFVLSLDVVGGAITADALQNQEYTTGMRARAMHAFHQKRSGDVIVWLQPQTHGSGTGGTGHGSGWVYDTHIPLIFLGNGITHGQSNEKVYVSDIASTVSVFLNSPFPSGNIGNPLNDLMRR